MKTELLPPLVSHLYAMGCPGEILLDTQDSAIAAEQLELAHQEAERIETKFSRYKEGNIIHGINTSRGAKIKVDDETAAILDYAAECYDLSSGLFDITTGVLRRGAPASSVGWNKVVWERPFIQLPEGFEIDFGGICKEYAADKILERLRKRHNISTVVNLGGDIAAAGDRLWSIGIEDPAEEGKIIHTVHLRRGGVATSGVTKRGGHILNPKTGKPVQNAPLSVTVAAKTCTEAGFWSTLAVLQGQKAEAFLKEQSLEAWCYRNPASSFPAATGGESIHL